MELFRETLEKTLQAKRDELSVFKKQTASTDIDVPEGTPVATGHPPLDYSVSKVVQTMREFEAERLKKSKRAQTAQKALKDTGL